ncbi:hypothetical protein Q31a_28090 [Aureliella helgolandensis]|uniref:Uncharacterized protein n=1 Tax=Aureliella helgolandensis TaxID=2527968 RepID=A0A518G7D8_9BACT|nr:hypothetical protein Q31a_28090 [Aureliella helgolandensis]
MFRLVWAYTQAYLRASQQSIHWATIGFGLGILVRFGGSEARFHPVKLSMKKTLHSTLWSGFSVKDACRNAIF